MNTKHIDSLKPNYRSATLESLWQHNRQNFVATTRTRIDQDRDMQFTMFNSR